MHISMYTLLWWHHVHAMVATLPVSNVAMPAAKPNAVAQTGFSEFQGSMSASLNGAQERPGDTDKRQALYGVHAPINSTAPERPCAPWPPLKAQHACAVIGYVILCCAQPWGRA